MGPVENPPFSFMNIVGSFCTFRVHSREGPAPYRLAEKILNTERTEKKREAAEEESGRKLCGLCEGSVISVLESFSPVASCPRCGMWFSNKRPADSHALP